MMRVVRNIRPACAALRRGALVVAPTDTIYGILACALSARAVEAVYRVRRRDAQKPLIILVDSLVALRRFGVVLTRRQMYCVHAAMRAARPTTVIVPLAPSVASRWHYLHRGTGALAFRIVRRGMIAALVRCTGPLVAPSANRQGMAPAETIADAQRAFGTSVAVYVDGGRCKGAPSRIVRCHASGREEVLRD